MPRQLTLTCGSTGGDNSLNETSTQFWVARGRGEFLYYCRYQRCIQGGEEGNRQPPGRALPVSPPSEGQHWHAAAPRPWPVLRECGESPLVLHGVFPVVRLYHLWE